MVVRKGLALDWPRYSSGRYDVFQRAAQSDKSGIWSGTFDEPWKWRAANGQAQLEIAAEKPAEDAEPFAFISGGSCHIKGNIAASGERICHVPGQAYYHHTVINRLAGERWVLHRGRGTESGMAAVKALALGVAPSFETASHVSRTKQPLIKWANDSHHGRPMRSHVQELIYLSDQGTGNHKKVRSW